MGIGRSPGCKCCPAGVNCTRCTNGAIPLTLHLTDPNGSWTLTWQAALSAWTVCYTITQTGEDLISGVCVATTVTVAVGYQLTCPDATNKFKLTQVWPYCSSPVGGRGAPGTCTADGRPLLVPGHGSGQTSLSFLSAVVAPNCRPLNLTFTVTGANVNGTVTVTE